MFDVEEILDIAIRLEKNGETVYQKAMEKVGRPDMISLLKWMRDEEAGHGEWFFKLKSHLQKEAAASPFKEINRQVLYDMIGEQSFSLKEVNFTTVQHLDELIRIFIEFEKDTILFYEMLQPFIEDKEVKAQLEEIIEEEYAHIGRLEEFLTSEADPKEAVDADILLR
jgi:rubrerythrin